MPISLKRTGVKFDAAYRNDTNDNWTSIEQAVIGVEDVSSAAEEIAQSALTLVNGANETSNAAVTIATNADGKSEATQAQLDNIIIESGTSDAETIQARGTFPVVNARLNSIDSSLAETANELMDKITLEEAKSNIGFADINKNKSLIDQTMVTQEFLAMIAGTAGVNATPALLSVITGMLANESVDISKLSIDVRNKLDLFNRLQVLSTNPATPQVGEMWLINAIWELIYQYSLTGTPGAALDTLKTTVLSRNQAGQTYNAAETFAKVSPTGDSTDIRFDPAVNSVNRGDTSIFPTISAIDLNLFKYRIKFDMTISSPKNSTELLGFAVQSDGTVAIADQTNYLSVRSVYVSATDYVFQATKTIGGVTVTLPNVPLIAADWPGNTPVEIVLEQNHIKVSLNGVLKIDASFDLSTLPAGLKASLYTQNRSTTTSALHRLANFTIEKFPK